MHARMSNPVMTVPDALQALSALGAAAKKGGVPSTTLYLVHLRASQINGCSYCVDMHARELKQAGATDERIFAVAAWRDSPHFTEPERAALALTEAATRLSDRMRSPFLRQWPGPGFAAFSWSRRDSCSQAGIRSSRSSG
jgi:AhpD family alkylhydroperoxidase